MEEPAEKDEAEQLLKDYRAWLSGFIVGNDLRIAALEKRIEELGGSVKKLETVLTVTVTKGETE